MKELCIVLLGFIGLPVIYWKGINLTANFANKFSEFLLDKIPNL